MSIHASSDAAFRRLVARFVAFYGERLFNPHWGEQAAFRPDNTLDIAMLFQGLDKSQAEDAWRAFFDWVAASPQDFSLAQPTRIIAIPARHLWDPEFLRKNAPSAILADDRAGAPENNVFWLGNLGEAGQFLHGYESVWLPAKLLHANAQKRLVDALFATSRVWRVSLHFNKGLAGAPAEARAAARDLSSSPVADRPHFPAFPDTSRICPLREKARAASLAPCTHCAMRCPRVVRTCRRRASSTDRGGKLIGDRTTPACAPSNVNMIPKAFSSFTTGWAAKIGARTATRGSVPSSTYAPKALLPDHVY